MVKGTQDRQRPELGLTPMPLIVEPDPQVNAAYFVHTRQGQLLVQANIDFLKLHQNLGKEIDEKPNKMADRKDWRKGVQEWY